jgi:hypothetical protein
MAGPAVLVTLLKPSLALLCAFFAASVAFSAVVDWNRRAAGARACLSRTRDVEDIAIDISSDRQLYRRSSRDVYTDDWRGWRMRLSGINGDGMM